MELVLPPREAVPACLGAMKALAMADGEFGDAERNLLAVAQRMLGSELDLDTLETVTPEALAEKLADPALRERIIRALVVMSMIDGEASPPEAALVERYATVLGVNIQSVHTLRKLAEGHIMSTRVDVARRAWVRDVLPHEWERKGLRGIAREVAAAAGVAESPKMAAKYRALEGYAHGTVGRAYFDFIRANDFRLPGERGGTPEFVVIHDLTHVLSGYGTDPQGETQVAAFSAGFRKTDAFAMIFFVMLQFHLGVRMAPTAKGEKGHFDPEKAMRALRRGAAMNRDITDGTWDPWSIMALPLDQARRDLGVPPPDAV